MFVIPTGPPAFHASRVQPPRSAVENITMFSGNAAAPWHAGHAAISQSPPIMGLSIDGALPASLEESVSFTASRQPDRNAARQESGA